MLFSNFSNFREEFSAKLWQLRAGWTYAYLKFPNLLEPEPGFFGTNEVLIA